MANSVEGDEASDLGLHCLQRPICPNTYGYYGGFNMITVTVIVLLHNRNVMKLFSMYCGPEFTNLNYQSPRY